MCRKCVAKAPSAAVVRRQADMLIFGLVVAGALSLIAVRLQLTPKVLGWLP